MIHTATFKGMRLQVADPLDKHLKISLSQEAVYQVQVFDDGIGAKLVYKARIIGGGRLDVRASTRQKAQALAAGFFREQITEWQENAPVASMERAK